MRIATILYRYILQHDMPERFLLHYFAMSAHAYTRAAATTPESLNVVDRNVPTGAYSAAGTCRTAH